MKEETGSVQSVAPLPIYKQHVELMLLSGFAAAVTLLDPLRYQAYLATDEYVWHKIWSAQRHLRDSQREIGEQYVAGRKEAA